MRCAPRASNGPDRLGLCAIQGFNRLNAKANKKLMLLPPVFNLDKDWEMATFGVQPAEVSHGRQLQSLWIVPAAAVS